jgi:RimJ/RimL family protein N-acetyltransferase
VDRPHRCDRPRAHAEDGRHLNLRPLRADGPTLERDGVLELGIEVDGELVGDVQARAPKRAFPPGVCEVGITIRPDLRGRGLGGQGLAAFVELLVAEHGMARIQASTAVGIEAMRRVLERLGWTFEGVLRDYFPREGGGREDYVLYAVSASERRPSSPASAAPEAGSARS